MKKRIIPAIIVVAVTAACVLISRPSRILFFALAGALSVYEMNSLLRQIGTKFDEIICYIYIAVSCALSWLDVPEIWLAAAFMAAVFAALTEGIVNREFDISGAIGTIFVLVYPCLPFAFIMFAAAEGMWLPVLSIAILGVWVCDSAALFAGKKWGKHKIAPYVSPNKTVEGCIAGALASVILGVILYFILDASIYITASSVIVSCLVASSFGQVGDLAASLIKRAVGAKDFGKLLPEHGGIMDKADSMLFAVPAAWFCLKLFKII